MLALLMPVSACFGLSPDQRFHQYIMDSWSIEQGLPQITVQALAQDSQGYIWAGTQAGLARFDGVRFESFDTHNTPELAGTLVQALLVDGRDQLWIGTYKGLSRYDNGRFSAIPAHDGSLVNVYQLAETSEGEIVAATASGLMRVEQDRLVSMEERLEGPVRAINIQGDQWLVGARGEVLVRQQGQWRQEPLSGQSEAVWVTGFARHDQRWWAATSDGLYWRDRTTWVPFTDDPRLTGRVIESIFEDREQNFWIATTGALFRLRGGSVVEMVSDEEPWAFGSPQDIIEDHEGSLWLGGRLDGLARLWNSWVFRYDKPEGLHNSLVWSVAPDGDGGLWVGTFDGVTHFDGERFRIVVPGSLLPHPHAYTLLHDGNLLWIGTRAGLVQFRLDVDELVLPEALKPLASTQVNGIIKTRAGEWRIATMGGLWRFDGNSLEQQTLANSDQGTHVRVLLETGQGRILAGTTAGLLAETENGNLERIESVGREHDLTSLYQLDDGRILAGTLGEKLLVQHDEGFRVLGVADGLPVNSPFAFGEKNGVLWVAGIRGIYELSLASLDDYLAGEIEQLPARMVLHERGDVLGAQKGYCCNGAGNAKGFMRDGEFWLPSRGGVVHLIPETIERNRVPPRVVIDRARVGGTWQLNFGDGALELEADQRDVAFGFTVLSFQDPSSVGLEYRLLGYSDEWLAVEDVSQRLAFYTNLPAGTFEFQVRGSNNSGVESANTARLGVTVSPRFQETAFFWMALGLVALILAGLLYRWRLRQLTLRGRELRQQVAERTEQLRVANEDLRKYSEQLKTASMTDPLTGLWNRRYLDTQLSSDLAHYRRQLEHTDTPGQCMVFGLVDIDHFKRINDRLGHGAGDDILRQFARVLLGLIREGDYVIRWGGEEFLIVFRPMSRAQIPRVGQRLIKTISEHSFTVNDGQSIDLSCSLGLSDYPVFTGRHDDLSWEVAVSLADTAAYWVKRRGRNGYCIIRPSSALESGELLRLLDAADLESMVESGQIELDCSIDQNE